MKLIYLDIDGVLTNLRTHIAVHGPGGLYTDYDPVAVAAIRRVCDEKSVRIVVSSSHRIGLQHCDQNSDGSRSKLSKAYKKYKLRQYLFDPRIDCGWGKLSGRNECNEAWKTVDYLCGSTCRGDQIEHHIQTWTARGVVIDDYIIIDDDLDMTEAQIKKGHFIHTNGCNGMSAEHIIKLYEWAGLMEKRNRDVDLSWKDNNISGTTLMT